MTSDPRPGTQPDTLAHGWDIWTACSHILGHVRSIDHKMGGGAALLARLAPPQGIEATGKGGGWWFLTWNAVGGASGYEQDHPDTGIGPTTGTRTSIFAVATGDHRVIRIRALSAGGPSPWATCTLWWDGRLKVDIDGGGDPPPPPPPQVPVITSVTAGHQNIAAWWDQPDEAADEWDVRVVDTTGQTITQQIEHEPRTVVNQLALGTRYGVQVAAIGPTGLRSEWSPITWTTTLDDPTGPPTPPTGLTVHCIADVSAKAEWDANTQVDGWEVWLDDDVDGTDFTISTLVRLVELEKDTEYTVNVVAVRGEQRSAPARITFRTLASILPPPDPDPDPDPDEGADYDEPSGLMVQPTGQTSVEAFWDDDGSDFAVVTLDGRQWTRIEGTRHEWEGLSPGVAYTAQVYTVTGRRISALARKAATTRREP